MSTAVALELTPPAQGAKITTARRQAGRPGQPHHPLHRGRRHRPGHLARQRARLRRRGAEGLRRQARRSTGSRSSPARKRTSCSTTGCRTRRSTPSANTWSHQGPAHHAGRRRHPLAQRRAAPDARSLRLPAPGALVQGRALAGEAPGEGRHGDLPREHRGHLRRHRVRGGQRGEPEVPRAVPVRTSPRTTQDPLSRTSSGIGIKPVSKEGTERLVRAAIEYALANKRKSVTLVHKGNIMKFTEGAFRDWGYELAEREFGRQCYTWEQWERTKCGQGRGGRPTPRWTRPRAPAASSSRTRSPTSRCSRC